MNKIPFFGAAIENLLYPVAVFESVKDVLMKNNHYLHILTLLMLFCNKYNILSLKM